MFARLVQLGHDHSRLVRVIVVFLIAPTVGSMLFGLLGQVFGIGEQLLIGNSTSVDDVLRALGFAFGGVIAGYALLRNTSAPAWTLRVDPADLDRDSWFPGRPLSGVALIAAPILLTAGELLRISFYYYFPSQLAAYQAHPQLMTASYSCYALGLLLLWPGFMTLVRLISLERPGWANWSGALVITGLLVRLYHEGVNHLAFQMVTYSDLETATHVVRESYPAWYVFYPLVVTDNAGWVVMAIGLYLSGRVGWMYCLAFLMMFNHSSGVLKGSDLGLVFYSASIGVLMIPLGLRLLQDGAGMSRRAMVSGALVVLFLAIVYGVTLTQ